MPTTPAPLTPAPARRVIGCRPALALVAAAATLCAGLLGAGVLSAAPARAATSDPVADSTANGPVIAQSTATTAAAGMTARASLPRTIVVSGHGGAPIALMAGDRVVAHRARPGAGPVSFTGLVPGTAYTVLVGRRSLGAVVALDRPSAVGRVVVTSPASGVARVAWTYTGRRTTGGSHVRFVVTATSATAPTVRTVVGAVRTTTLSGLDTSAIYTFTVTASNSAGAGRPTSATMRAPLGGGMSATSAQPTTTATPSARLVYVCPDGYGEMPDGTCQRTQPYTYSTIPYTYHAEATGPAPLLNEYTTTIPACPAGYSLADYGWVMYCRAYGPAPTVQVKDPTPAGYTDTGSAWSKRDPAPDGYSDGGGGWVRVVPKVAVPA